MDVNVFTNVLIPEGDARASVSVEKMECSRGDLSCDFSGWIGCNPRGVFSSEVVSVVLLEPWLVERVFDSAGAGASPTTKMNLILTQMPWCSSKSKKKSNHKRIKNQKKTQRRKHQLNLKVLLYLASFCNKSIKRNRKTKNKVSSYLCGTLELVLSSLFLLQR